MRLKRILLLFGLFGLSILSINAAEVTWIGGNGDWDVDSNWDTGQVPDYDDGAYIPSGTVTIDDFVQVAYIHLDGGHLEVTTGTLFITIDEEWSGYSTKGIDIESGSSFNNYGTTVIIESFDFVGNGALIFCNGEMTNHATGFIYLQGYQSTGIHSYLSSSTIYNYGEIRMDNMSTGMYLLEPFNNYGDIEIEASSIGVLNRESFYSSSASTLVVDGTVQINLGAIWNQYGSMEIHYTSTSNASAISIDGTFEIKSTGSLLIDGSYVGVTISSTGTLRNRGLLDITNDHVARGALGNAGFLVNHQSGVINTRAHYGVSNYSDAEIRNYGVWNMHTGQSTYRAFHNYGVFSNRPKGKLSVFHRLELESGSFFNNQGHMFVNGTLSHVELSGQFNNTAALNDVHGNMSSINNNTSIRVHKMVGPFTEGVPVNNILDLGSTPSATVLTFYTTATGGTVAGTYNSSTNSFTPNNNAVGLSSLFVRIRINAGGVTRRHELMVENGINSSPAPMPDVDNEDAKQTSLRISPNPIQSSFSIDLKNYDAENIEYAIFNCLGQLQSKGVVVNTFNTIELPSKLQSGIYFIRVMNSEGTVLESEQIRILR